MLQPTVDALRSWEGALNRFGFGALGLLIVNSFPIVPNSVRYHSLTENVSSVGLLPVFLVLIVVSLVFGQIIMGLGTTMTEKKFSEEYVTMLAARVGMTNNSILLARFRDASLRYDALVGFYGLWIFIVVITIGITVVYTSDPAYTSEMPDQFWNFSKASVVAVLAILLAWALRSSAYRSLQAVEKALNDLYPEAKPQ